MSGAALTKTKLTQVNRNLGGGTQKTLLAFFKGGGSSPMSAGKKVEVVVESLKDSYEQDAESAPTTPPPAKKLKTEGDALLTPEQKIMISDKAAAAKTLQAIRKLHSELPILDCKIGHTWFTALKNEFEKDYFTELNKTVMSARGRCTVYPAADNVWEWTKQVPIRDIKVVILGQDPYHGPNQAHGLCFSVKKGVQPPPSLQNMYKELATDIEGFHIPKHGYLQGWAEQGVLLLNAVLTVEAGKANSHQGRGWEKLTDAVISWISKNLDSVVFLLWGSYAQKKASIVDKKKHHLLQAVHPSPLSAHRGFFGSKHFSKCNELLKKSGKSPIDWNNLP